MWHSTSSLLCCAVLFLESSQRDPSTAQNWLGQYWLSADPVDLLKHGAGLIQPAYDQQPKWPDVKPHTSTRFFYLLQLAFWVTQVFFVHIESRRSDFTVTLTHHIAASFLLLLSWTCGLYRFGLITLILHDPVDVLLYLGKCFTYTRWTKAADLIFSVFVIAWFLFRIYLFPVFCVIPSFYLDHHGKLFGADHSKQLHLPGGIILPTLLCALQVKNLQTLSWSSSFR